MNKDIKELNYEYDTICMKWIDLFCRKQDLTFEAWADHNVVADFGGTWFFNLDDIILDLTKGTKPGLILDWQEESLEFHQDNPNKPMLNYNSYIMGARYE